MSIDLIRCSQKKNWINARHFDGCRARTVSSSILWVALDELPFRPKALSRSETQRRPLVAAETRRSPRKEFTITQLHVSLRREAGWEDRQYMTVTCVSLKKTPRTVFLDVFSMVPGIW